MHRLVLLLLVFGCGGDSSPRQVDAGTDAAVDGSPIDALVTLNGCTPEMAVDRTGAGDDRTIQFADDFYAPPCIRIRAGQSITWSGTFSSHPLAPGILRANMVVDQPGTPITLTSSGTTKNVTFAAAGPWAFYCPNHPPGMAGVVYVDP